MNLEQRLAKCNQALSALEELRAIVWMDSPLRDTIDDASDRINKIKSILRLRETQREREKSHGN